MRTDDLIRALAADQTSRPEPVARRFAIFSIAGLLAAACVFGFALTPRPDLGAALGTLRVAFKFLIALTLASAAGLLAVRLTRPEAEGDFRPVLAPVLALLAFGIGAELVVSPPAAWRPLLIGSNAVACLALIPLFSLAPLGAVLMALRHGAPSRPGRAGAVAGLFAGGLGAALYAMHCTDDSPLFVAAWYGLAVAVVAALGSALGAKTLRW